MSTTVARAGRFVYANSDTITFVVVLYFTAFAFLVVR